MATKKLKLEEYIQDCKEEHDNFYDYSETKYLNSRTPVVIICPTHGRFSQKAESHKSGKGCPGCGRDKRSEKSRRPTTDKEEFIALAQCLPQLNQLIYDYSNIVYVNRKTRVSIICPLHGVFSQKPRDHLLGGGCPRCAGIARNLTRAMSNEVIASRSREINGDKYSYNNVDYLNDKTKISITCKKHGDFLQLTTAHLRGQGCPKCMRCGYNTGKPGYLYILTLGSVTKVGITNRTPKERVKEISKGNGPKFNITSSLYFEDGSLARTLEVASHKWLATQYQRVDEVFDGSTECFLNVDLPSLINFVTPHVSPEPV